MTTATVPEQAVWSEREVRRLLRALRRPHTLARVPLALALCQAYGIDDPLEASRRFIKETFEGGGLVGTRLAEILERSDVDASMPLVSIAKDMGVSPRQFFRYRREAIRALADRAGTLGGRPMSARDAIARIADLVAQTDPEGAAAIARLNADVPLDAVTLVDNAVNAGALGDIELPAERGPRLIALCRIARGCFLYGGTDAGRRIATFVRAQVFDALIEERRTIDFQLAYLAYLDELYCGTAAAGRIAAETLMRRSTVLANPPVMAYTIAAEAALRDGDESGANEAIGAADRFVSASDVRSLTILLALRGATALARNDYVTTDDCYTAAGIVLGRRAISQWNVEFFVGTARRLSGKGWHAPAFATSIQDLGGKTLVLDGTESVELPRDNRAAPTRLALAVLSLRTALSKNVTASAEGALDNLLALARSRGYPAIVAAAQATLAELQMAGGRPSEARAQVVAAWNTWTGVADYLALVDLFAFSDPRAYACAHDNAELVEALLDWAAEHDAAHPLATMPRSSAREVVTAAWAARATAALPPFQPVSPPDRIAAALLAFVPPAHRASAAQTLQHALRKV